MGCELLTEETSAHAFHGFRDGLVVVEDGRPCHQDGRTGFNRVLGGPVCLDPAIDLYLGAVVALFDHGFESTNLVQALGNE